MGEKVQCFETAEDLFKSGAVDAVIIATPHYFHPPLAIKAMKHGLHVLIEKPAGVYTKQVRELNAFAQKTATPPVECPIGYGVASSVMIDHLSIDKRSLNNESVPRYSIKHPRDPEEIIIRVGRRLGGRGGWIGIV